MKKFCSVKPESSDVSFTILIILWILNFKTSALKFMCVSVCVCFFLPCSEIHHIKRCYQILCFKCVLQRCVWRFCMKLGNTSASACWAHPPLPTFHHWMVHSWWTLASNFCEESRHRISARNRGSFAKRACTNRILIFGKVFLNWTVFFLFFFSLSMLIISFYSSLHKSKNKNLNSLWIFYM